MMPASAKARVTAATCPSVKPLCSSLSNRSVAASSPPVMAMVPKAVTRAQSSLNWPPVTSAAGGHPNGLSPNGELA